MVQNPLQRLRAAAVSLALALLLAAPAAADFVEACTASSNLDAKICGCCRDKAEERLSPEGVELVIAMMRKDKTRGDALRAGMAPADILAAGMFMVGTPGECARELEP